MGGKRMRSSQDAGNARAAADFISKEMDQLMPECPPLLASSLPWYKEVNEVGSVAFAAFKLDGFGANEVEYWPDTLWEGRTILLSEGLFSALPVQKGEVASKLMPLTTTKIPLWPTAPLLASETHSLGIRYTGLGSPAHCAQLAMEMEVPGRSVKLWLWRLGDHNNEAVAISATAVTHGVTRSCWVWIQTGVLYGNEFTSAFLSELGIPYSTEEPDPLAILGCLPQPHGDDGHPNRRTAKDCVLLQQSYGDPARQVLQGLCPVLPDGSTPMGGGIAGIVVPYRNQYNVRLHGEFVYQVVHPVGRLVPAGYLPDNYYTRSQLHDAGFELRPLWDPVSLHQLLHESCFSSTGPGGHIFHGCNRKA